MSKDATKGVETKVDPGVPVTVFLPKELHYRARMAALKGHTTLKALVLEAVASSVDRAEKGAE
jgi:hypothetical protein